MPAVAGTFYPSESGALKSKLQQLFTQAGARARIFSNKEYIVGALMAPHAGYVYSGEVAASVYRQLGEDAVYNRVFLIGSSHRASFRGASVYTQGDYLTPLGSVEVDEAVGQALIKGSSLFNDNASPHLQEHSLEVQLPFLQYRLKHSFKLVPIVIGTNDPLVCKELAEALRPWFTEDNLFVISTDFSHYPSYEEARKIDEHTLMTILKNQPKRLLEVLDENKRLNVPGLATSLCGWSSVLTLLHLTCSRSNLTYKHVAYMNSGDSKYGDKNQVVGYQGVVVLRKRETTNIREMALTETDKKWLLNRARHAILLAIGLDELNLPEDIPAVLSRPAGVFVSLYKNGELRGCIGTYKGHGPLWKSVEKMAASAALNDTRFSPLEKDELNDVTIELSVLTPARKISDVSEIETGKHGIVVAASGRSGVFLPQVAARFGWDVETLLGHCAHDKANLGWDGWKKAEISVFEAIVFHESPVIIRPKKQ